MQTNRSFFIALGTFLFVACGAFAFSFVFYLSGVSLAVIEVILLLFAALGVFFIIKGTRLPKTAALTRREATVRLAVTAVMLGCVAVTKLFRLEIPMFGGAGMTVGFSGVFTSIPAMLYGPLFGAAASACSDILGCIINPIGAYNPLFTLTAFVGGFIKGSIWLLIKDRKGNTLRIVSAVAAVLLIVLGVSTNISLNNDGVFNGVLASAEDVPSRGKVDNMKKSPLTELVTSLASYTNDTYSITSADDGEKIVVPSHIVVDGVKYTTRIKGGAFDGCNGEVYIPSNIKKIDAKAFHEGMTVHVEESTRELLKGISGITVVVEDSIEKTAAEGVYGGTAQKAGGFGWTSTQAHTTAVAKYINFLTLGPIIAGGSMLVIIAIGLVVIYIRKKRGNEATGVSGVRVFIALFGAGCVSTTINTLILQYITYPSWADRAFYILWIPRVAEELIVCMIQAYFVALLYDLYKSRFASRIHH